MASSAISFLEDQDCEIFLYRLLPKMQYKRTCESIISPQVSSQGGSCKMAVIYKSEGAGKCKAEVVIGVFGWVSWLGL